MIVLPPVCDRAATAALYPEMSESLGSHPLAIDASRVERLGQAMLQVLVSAARTECGIVINEPSAAFTATLRLTGLEKVVMEGIAA